MSDETPLVLIEWEDSARPIPEWLHLSDYTPSAAVKCASVGWLIQDDEMTKALAPNMGEIESASQIQACGIIRIPARAITRIVRLVEVENSVTVFSCPSSRPERARRQKSS